MAQVNDVHAATVQTPSAASAGASSWQPLRQPVFRMLWIATVVSNIGSWMNDVGVNWTMLTLSANPLSVALVQAASSLPMFLRPPFRGDGGHCRPTQISAVFPVVGVYCRRGLTLLSLPG
jgi:hypothetical protein